MLDEQQITELLKNKNKEAISILYDRYAPALYGIVLRIVKTEALAQDVLQDTFIKVWKNCTNYNASKGKLFTWLLNIARNTAIDKTRSAHFRNNGKIQPIDYFVNSNEQPFKHEMNVDDIGIRKKIDILEEKYKTIIDLIYFNGYTQREVAEHLSLPLGTVKSRIRIALRVLRNALSEQTQLKQVLD